MTQRYGCDDKDIRHYTCRRTNEKIVVDGRLAQDVWQRAPRSPRFVDMVTGEPGFLDTRVAALWDDENLYLGFWIEEPNVQAHFTERDSPIYFENDVEVFIAGPDCYYEFEVNARGTIYEVFYIWQDAYKKGGFFDPQEFDLQTRTVDVLGGFQDAMRYHKHPRGRRWAFMDWDFPGLKTAVHVDGRFERQFDDRSRLDRRTGLSVGWDENARARSQPAAEGRRHLANGLLTLRDAAIQPAHNRPGRGLVVQHARCLRLAHSRVFHLCPLLGGDRIGCICLVVNLTSQWPRHVIERA